MTTTTQAAKLSMEHAEFQAPPLHIPNRRGQTVKTELVIHRSTDRTVKINWWHRPDDDREIGQDRPHNHPWTFTSEILHGGYTEQRFSLYVDDDVGVHHVHTEQLVHKAGDLFVVPDYEYHLVTSVEPGTVTRMVCGPVVQVWGYLDIETAKHMSVADRGFYGRLLALNEFKRDR